MRFFSNLKHHKLYARFFYYVLRQYNNGTLRIKIPISSLDNLRHCGRVPDSTELDK